MTIKKARISLNTDDGRTVIVEVEGPLSFTQERKLRREPAQEGFATFTPEPQLTIKIQTEGEVRFIGDADIIPQPEEAQDYDQT